MAVAKTIAETISEKAAAKSLLEDVEGIGVGPFNTGALPSDQTSSPVGLAGRIAVAMTSTERVKAAKAASVLFRVTVIS